MVSRSAAARGREPRQDVGGVWKTDMDLAAPDVIGWPDLVAASGERTTACCQGFWCRSPARLRVTLYARAGQRVAVARNAGVEHRCQWRQFLHTRSSWSRDELEPDVALVVPLLLEHTIQVIQKWLHRLAHVHHLTEKIGCYHVRISEVMHDDDLFELQELNLRMCATEALGCRCEFFAFNRSESVGEGRVVRDHLQFGGILINRLPVFRQLRRGGHIQPTGDHRLTSRFDGDMVAEFF